MRIKLDENLDRSIAELLRNANHDVATVYEQDLTSAPDPWIFNACLKESRVLVTLDLDFANAQRFDPSGSPGVAVLRVPTLPGHRDLLDGCQMLIATLEQDEIRGQLWIVDRTRVRRYEPGDGEG